MSHSGWIGVDLDGTLAEYHGWAEGMIGKPIPKMLQRVKYWLLAGKDVRIFTARVSHPVVREKAKALIEQWCVIHIGKILPITCRKDFEMIELWDDRCVQIIPNTGERADGQE
jgi:hypothetical protein